MKGILRCTVNQPSSDNGDGDCNCDGDVEGQHNELRVLNKDICMLYAEKGRDNKFGACAHYALVGPKLHAANVTITLPNNLTFHLSLQHCFYLRQTKLLHLAHDIE
jgi:hypothetical protein